MNVRQIPLGITGVRVSEMIFGGAPIGGLYAPVSDDQAAATLEGAWAAGIRAFDTAPHYGVGLSEQRLGRFLGDRPRGEFVLSSLRHPAVTAVVVGARDATEVIEDVSYLTAAVPAELFDELAAEHLMPIMGDRP